MMIVVCSMNLAPSYKDVYTIGRTNIVFLKKLRKIFAILLKILPFFLK